MVSKKYVTDYKLDVEYNPLTGRQKTTAHYVGPRYSFDQPEDLPGTKVLFTVLSLVITVSHVTMLILNAPCIHVWYVSGALVLMMLPVIFLLAALRRLLTAKENVTREHRDKIEERYPVVLLGCIVLSGLGLVGHLVYSIRIGDRPADLIFYILTVVILASSLILFSVRHRIGLHETDPGMKEDADNIK